MSRAWPFEDRPEAGGQRIDTPEQWAELFGNNAQAVVIRIGLGDAQLVLVAESGRWDRWVYHSTEEAKAAAEHLSIPVHEGEYPEDLRVTINSYRRPPRDYDLAPYPEQGEVGPVIPYPENRPRKTLEDAAKKSQKILP